MANNILKIQGHSIGKSIQEDNCDSIINEIFKSSKNHSCEIIFPEDVVVANNMEIQKIKNLNEIKDDYDFRYWSKNN